MTWRRRVGRLIIALLVVLIGVMGLGFASVAQEPKLPYALGLVPSPAGDYPRVHTSAGIDSLPDSIDLSDGLPPVGHQRRQASCVGWAIAHGYRSYQEGVERGWVPTHEDEIFSPAFIYNQRTTNDCSNDAGMSMVDGLRIAVRKGVATSATMPYDANDSCSQPSAEARAEAGLYRSKSYANLFAGRGTANLTALKQHLATGDPFLLAVPVYSEFYRVSRSDPVIDVPEPGSVFYGGHAILVVGYDEAAHTFKFVNSWGTGWAKKGFAHLTYDFVKRNSWEAWVLVDIDTTPPSLPDQAYELGGVESGVAQSEVDSPVFAWEKSNDPTAMYRIYWGPNPEGVGNHKSLEAFLAPSQVNETTTLYLRVRAQDATGNSTDWQTLFEFSYEQPDVENQLVPLQPVIAHRRRD